MADPKATTSTSHQGQEKADLSGLPHEILTIICGFLPPPALKNARLVSKTFAAVGAFYLLPTINLSNESPSFERLQQVTQESAMCPGVQQLHYDITNLACFKPVEDWTRFWPTVNTPDPKSILEVFRLLRIPNETLSGQGPGGDPSIAKVRKAVSEMQSHIGLAPPECFIRVCRAYQAVSTDQERMRWRENREEEFATIVNAFKRMPNLKAVTLDITPLYTAGLDYADASDSEIMWTFAHHVATTFKGLDPPGVLELMMILRASAEAGGPLQHLRCHHLNWRFFPRPDKDFSDIDRAMSRLESLNLSIDVNGYDQLGEQ